MQGPEGPGRATLDLRVLGWRRGRRTLAVATASRLRLGPGLGLVVATVIVLTAGGTTGNSTALVGECQGSITVRPTSGYAGDTAIIEITVMPPFHRVITDVYTDHTQCGHCPASRRRPGQFIWIGSFPQNSGPVNPVQFIAYDRDKQQRCSGFTSEALTSRGPR